MPFEYYCIIHLSTFILNNKVFPVMESLCPQEDGGAPGSARSVLSEDFPESATSAGGSDAVCGDVSCHQYLYILQWPLQPTGGHVSSAGLRLRRDQGLWTKCSSATKEQACGDGGPSSVICQLMTSANRTHLNSRPCVGRLVEGLGGFI